MTEKNVLSPKKALNEEIGEDIGFELGMKLVKDYYDVTGDRTSHFIGRNILERLLAQPECIGLRIYKALNEQGNQTYVIIGLDSKGEPILEYPVVGPDGSLSKTPGIVADRTPGDKSTTYSWFD